MKITMELVDAIHANAVAHGFWSPAPSWPQQIALVHTEPSEITEGDRDGSPMSVKIPGFTNHEEELADTVIRACDVLGGYAGDCPSRRRALELWLQADALPAVCGDTPNKDTCVADLHAHLSRAYECGPDTPGAGMHLTELLRAAQRYADHHGLRLAEAVRAKHEYNKSRPYKHGKEF